MTEFFSKPLNTFLVGVGLGLALALYSWLKGLWRLRQLRRDNEALKEQLHRQMTIYDKGHEEVLAEAKRLRQENENLRITVATLKAKPGRAELQLLHVYDRAVRLMHQKAPGFGPAWEGVMAEAQRELEQTDTGLAALVRKAFRPSLPGASGGGGAGEPPAPASEKSGETDGETAREARSAD
jgi:hypothetical protein